MPRSARKKSPESIFHIMCRSISDVNLFRDDEDKDKYIKIVIRFMEQFAFKVGAYCLMDTHVHLLIDANGADVSKFMHCINQCYAYYFNRKYGRHGHVFQDRFKSSIINNERYLLTVSAYIHNNPSDIEEYSNRVEEYYFSSLAVFLGLRKDNYNIIDNDFIMSLLHKNNKMAKKDYLNYVYCSNDKNLKKEIEFQNEKAEYRGERIVLYRKYKPEKVIDFVSKITSTERHMLHFKYCKSSSDFRALSVFLIRYFCDKTYKEICKVIGDLSQASLSRLCNIGLDLIKKESKYKNIINEFCMAS